MSRHEQRVATLVVAMSLGLGLGLLPRLAGAQAGSLFPQPFQVRHHLVQDDGDGSRFASDTVTDTYGGSWIISERPDGSRLVVDLTRREVTGIQPDKGTYWTVSFDRLGELPAGDGGRRAAERACRRCCIPRRREQRLGGYPA